MALSSEEFVDLNRQARRRAERAAQTMSSQGVSSEEYLKKLRAKRRPTRRFEVSETPAAALCNCYAAARATSRVQSDQTNPNTQRSQAGAEPRQSKSSCFTDHQIAIQGQPRVAGIV
ncbi:hypothetical protein C8035_v007522 [Colletotrichum spinosum]|uniref:Uncharacterized protein n=1 Tax=Colletotrichum spinosum TaxID=1347390 RepID=A0A4V3HQP0_9PEZI|nr:hypothetical protein C8035_v007522 [Colletotrichum spinosum]